MRRNGRSRKRGSRKRSDERRRDPEKMKCIVCTRCVTLERIHALAYTRSSAIRYIVNIATVVAHEDHASDPGLRAWHAESAIDLTEAKQVGEQMKRCSECSKVVDNIY